MGSGGRNCLQPATKSTTEEIGQLGGGSQKHQTKEIKGHILAI